MRDIPVFTTQNGVASLILKNIPYCADAYIQIQDASDTDALLLECVDFCKAVGAERVFASNVCGELGLSLFTEVWEMSAAIDHLPDTEAIACPVVESDLEQWRQTYNLHMKDVPTAAYLSAEDIKSMNNQIYYVYNKDIIIGLGIASGGRIDGIVSLYRGKGQGVFCALCKVMDTERVLLEVASENKRAISLYRRLGFEKTAVLNRWYCALPK